MESRVKIFVLEAEGYFSHIVLQSVRPESPTKPCTRLLPAVANFRRLLSSIVWVVGSGLVARRDERAQARDGGRYQVAPCARARPGVR